jgi:hypothetical protein
VELVRERHPALERLQDGVLGRVDRLVGAEDDLDPRDHEERPEDVHDPVELEEERAERDEDRPEDEGPEDPPVEDPVLVGGRDAEELEKDDEDEDVVDRERLLDDVARQELQEDLPRRGAGGRSPGIARRRGSDAKREAAQK